MRAANDAQRPTERGLDVPADSLDGTAAAELQRQLDVPELRLFESVASTLDVAHRLGEAGVPHGTLIVADRQTAGRGRGGKSWASPPGAGLWLTIVARPRDAVVPQVLTVRLGLAAARALDALATEPIRIKWPNDLYLRARKLAGVLVEARWRGGRAEWLAVGIGINVSAPGDPGVGAALGTRVARLDVLRAVMPELRAALDRGDMTLDAREHAEYDIRDRARGARCIAPRPGVVRGITGTAELLVETPEGVTAIATGSLVLAEDS